MSAPHQLMMSLFMSLTISFCKFLSIWSSEHYYFSPLCFIFIYLFKFLLLMHTIYTVDIIIYLVQMDSLKKKTLQ